MVVERRATCDQTVRPCWRVVQDLIRGIDVATLTTPIRNGLLQSRPVVTQEEPPSEALWFFAGTRDPACEPSGERRVNVTYANHNGTRFVSLSGVAKVVRDPALVRRFWSPRISQRFSRGVNDPDAVLLRVEVHHGQYWDGAHRRFVDLPSFSEVGTPSAA